jgi:sulfide:quinone oxidoreductase
MNDEPSSEGARVVIAGGGVAGIEALLALRDLAGDRANLTLVAPQPDFLYKPLLVEEPFGLDPAERRELAPVTEEVGATLVQAALSGVRNEDQMAELADGTSLAYDQLVVAVGGHFRPAFKGVATFPSPAEQLTVEELLTKAHVRGSDTIAFIVPPGVAWSLPLYEIALMTERRARERSYKELSIRFLTPEQSPLAIFGAAASAAVQEMLQARRIQFSGGTLVHQEDGELVLTPGGGRLGEAEAIALPVMEGPAIDGLPADDSGFIPIDQHCRVRSLDNVYAAGDGTNFPIKQGGLATQQADAAATHIAHRLGAAIEPEPFRPLLRGKLLTGAESIHMRADVSGGAGEGETSLDSLWWPPQKISGRYLAPWLYHSEGGVEPAPPGDTVDVKVAFPTEWHEHPMALDPDSPPQVD